MWYVLRTAPRREIDAAQALGDVGCGVYCPTQWLFRQRRGRNRNEEPIRVAHPLYGGYVFANVDDERELFTKLAKLSNVGSFDIEPMRRALIARGEVIEDGRLARAGSGRWKRSGIQAVLSSDGAPVPFPQVGIDAIVRIENDLRFVPAPPPVLLLVIGDRVTVTLGPEGVRSGFVAGKPKGDGRVLIEVAGERKRVPMSSLRLVA